MALSPGARVGPYEVVDQIGVGGMGEVYRARDARLGRDVALKILPELFAVDGDRLARFRREAQVLASLNHPNIAHIYGIEEVGDVHALVMELVEGPTLDDMIRGGGGLPLSDALSIAKQVAVALETAHEQGIIHRDLKPANVKVRPDGTVKVLDFGLAKAVEPTAASGSASASMSPTLTTPAMTEMGVILGTAAYMSPEQAKGQPANRRSDVWAFGALLYEMLTGRRAFEADGLSETIASVLRSEVDWSVLPPGLPTGVALYLRRALVKDPKQRVGDMQDMRLALEGAFDGAPVAVARRAPWVPWAVAGLFGLSSLYLLLSGTGTPARSGSTVAASVTLPADVEYWGAPAISADGSTVAFVGIHNGQRTTYVRRLDDFEIRPLDNLPVNNVALSPDGQAAAIVTMSGDVMRLSADGRVSQTLATGANLLSGVRWTLDDRLVYDRSGGLTSISAAGGDAQVITTYDEIRGETAHRWPVVSTDGRFVFFTSDTVDGGGRLEAASLADGTRWVVEPGVAQAIWASSTQLVFVRDGDVLLGALDGGQVVGLPRATMSNVTSENPIAGSSAALSDAGTLVIASEQTLRTKIIWVTEDGMEEAVTDQIGQFDNPKMSPDGRSVVYSTPAGVWRLDLARGVPTLVGRGIFPTWLDSSRIAFTSSDGVVVASADGERAAEPLPGTIATDYVASVSPDGSQLAVVRVTPESSGDVVLLPLDGSGDARVFVSTPAYEGGAQFSPDGRWLLYTSDESGQQEVYVRSYPDGDRRLTVSTGGGIHPMWRGDGRRIFYRRGTAVFAVDVDPRNADLALSSSVELFEGPYKMGGNITIPNYSMDADGRRFLFLRMEPGSQGLRLMTNWLPQD